MRAFSCADPKERQLDLVPRLLFCGGKTRTAHNWPSDSTSDDESKEQVWLHGSLMLQQTLTYTSTRAVSRSLVNLPPAALVRVSNDKSGSHVIEGFLASDSINHKHKSQLIGKLRGNFVKLAADRHGSRIIDYLADQLDDKSRPVLLDELSSAEQELRRAGKIGRLMVERHGLHTWRTKGAEEWSKSADKKKKRADRFKDIVHEKNNKEKDLSPDVSQSRDEQSQ